MKIALYSDLHTEFWSKDKSFDPWLRLGRQDNPEYCKIVVLAGDIASGRRNVKKVLEKFATIYEHVIYVPGNHEYYGSDYNTFNYFPEVAENIHILNPGTIKINDVTFIGASLWTNFGNDPWAAMAAKDNITDFRLIKNFYPYTCERVYETESAYIKKMYDSNSGKKVIITHFLPAQECISERFRGPNLLNKYFANDMGNWISNLENTTWMHGHTHDSIDITIGETRILCNPYGYWPKDINPNHNDLVVEV
jgi:Icc-related predicted phosphoesterase